MRYGFDMLATSIKFYESKALIIKMLNVARHDFEYKFYRMFMSKHIHSTRTWQLRTNHWSKAVS